MRKYKNRNRIRKSVCSELKELQYDLYPTTHLTEKIKLHKIAVITFM